MVSCYKEIRVIAPAEPLHRTKLSAVDLMRIGFAAPNIFGRLIAIPLSTPSAAGFYLLVEYDNSGHA